MISIKTINHLLRAPEGHFAILVGLGLFLFAAPPVSGQCLYETTIIQGPLCADGSPATFGPRALDEQGNVAGASSCFLAVHGALWTGSGLGQFLPDSGESQALAILDPDHVVGTHVQAGEGFDVAAYWEFGVLRILGALPGQFTSKAHAINSSRQIVGWSLNTSTGDSGAFLWENGEFLELVNFPMPPPNIPNDLNDQGQIVGYMGGAPTTSNAFLWENGIVTDLGKIPGGNSASAVAINNIGHIGGFGMIPMEGTIFGVSRGFFWDGQTMIDIGTLPDHLNSGISDINDLNEMVGESWHVGSNINISHAIYWRDGVLYDLNDLVVPDPGGGLRRAWAINNAGEILAQVGGAGVLLTPIGSAPGDIDNNCFVNVSDLLLLIGEWGKAGSFADINEDGNVNVTDLLALLASWG